MLTVISFQILQGLLCVFTTTYVYTGVEVMFQVLQRLLMMKPLIYTHHTVNSRYLTRTKGKRKSSENQFTAPITLLVTVKRLLFILRVNKAALSP